VDDDDDVDVTAAHRYYEGHLKFTEVGRVTLQRCRDFFRVFLVKSIFWKLR